MADREFKLTFLGDSSKAEAAMGRVDGGLGKMGTSFGKVTKLAGGLAAGAGLLALPGLLTDMVSAAAEDEQATARLDLAIKNLTDTMDDGSQAYKEIRGDIDERIKAGQKLAFTDDEVRDSLQSLLAATGDYGDAVNRQKAAMDLARGANIPFATATKMLGKLNEDNIEVFKKLGIVIGDTVSETEALEMLQGKFGTNAKLTKAQADAFGDLGIKVATGARGTDAMALAIKKLDGTTKITDKQKDAMKALGFEIAGAGTEADVLAAVQKKFGGQAETYAKSTAGQFEVAKIQMSELKEQMGSALLPVVAKLAPLLIKVFEALAKVPAPMLAIGAGVAMVVAGLVLLAPALSGIVALAPLVGGAFTLMLGPVGLVVIAIAGLIAIGVELWKNWDAVVNKAHDVAAAIAGVTGFNSTPASRGWGFNLPGFDSGGIVPGPLGSPQLAMVHGGETILPTHRGGMGGLATVIINVDGFVLGSSAELTRLVQQALNDGRQRYGGAGY